MNRISEGPTKSVLVTAVLVLIALPLTGHAVTLQVNCDQPKSKLPTISSAVQTLKGLLGNLGPNTIEVTGACNENITIESMEQLTLRAKNGASITDASGGTTPAITVDKSSNVTLVDFAIRGGGGFFHAAVICQYDSTCRFSSNDVQDSNGNAVAALFGATVTFDRDVLEQSATGLFVFAGSRATVLAATFRNNGTGVNVSGGSSYADNSTTIANNSGSGLFVNNHSVAISGNDTITGNGIGVNVNVQSEFFARFGSISGNGTGISIGHASWVNFNGGMAVSGSGTQPDIQCWGHFSGASGIAQAGTTNCPP